LPTPEAHPRFQAQASMAAVTGAMSAVLLELEGLHLDAGIERVELRRPVCEDSESFPTEG
jgi:hypothetical protein